MSTSDSYTFVTYSVWTALPSFSLLIPATSLLYCVGLVVYRLYFHPLARFPGRKLAAATRWYEFFFDCIKGDGGQYMWEVERMHKEYGSIIRVTPHEIKIKNVEYYDVLYANGSLRDKYGTSAKMAGCPLSAFGTEPHALHKLRRTPLNPFFSKRSVAAFQPKIQELVEDLCIGLRDCMERNEVVQLRVAFLSLTIDVICTYAFGKSLGALKQPGFSPQWNAAIAGTAEAAPVTKQFAGIVQYLQKIPLPIIKFLHPNLGQLLGLRKVLRSQVASIIAQYQNDTIPSDKSVANSHRTIFHMLIESSLPENEKSEERLTDEAFALIGAGTETTKQTMNCLTYFVLSDPAVLTQLKKELWEAMPNPRACPSLHVLESLPYLNSIVKETLRIATTVTSRLPLIAPTQTLEYGDWKIPAGTPISMDFRTSMIDPAIFSDPMSFQPNRWLRSMESGQRLERYLMPFSRGPRGCLGQNLALAEIYLATAALFRRFEFQLFETDRRAVTVTRDNFAAGLDKGSLGTRVRILREYVD